MTTKLDELKARVYDSRVFYHPDAEATLRVSTIKALIAAVEALKQIDDVLSAAAPITHKYQCKAIARAALAPFGE